jgi:hypothetical protein
MKSCGSARHCQIFRAAVICAISWKVFNEMIRAWECSAADIASGPGQAEAWLDIAHDVN